MRPVIKWVEISVDFVVPFPENTFFAPASQLRMIEKRLWILERIKNEWYFDDESNFRKKYFRTEC